MKKNIKIIIIVGEPSSQAPPGYLITASPSVCVPDVIGVLAVWISNHFFFLGITWVSNPATRQDLAARTWGVFWY